MSCISHPSDSSHGENESLVCIKEPFFLLSRLHGGAGKSLVHAESLGKASVLGVASVSHHIFCGTAHPESADLSSTARFMQEGRQEDLLPHLAAALGRIDLT